MNAITDEVFLTEQERAQVENRDLMSLQKALGYTFHDMGLLQEALCHSSFANEHGLHKSNERLEFLGDSVLNYVVARILFTECPNAAEGELTRMRSELVRESSLYSRAITLRVPDLLLHGRSMHSADLPKSICANAVEAIIGAICLDGGIEAGSQVVERLFLNEIRKIHDGQPMLDPKSRLQALLQARGIPVPTYELLSVTGPSHMPVFHVKLRVNGVECVADGSTRKGAESTVAAEMMRALAFPETVVTKSELSKLQGAAPVMNTTGVDARVDTWVDTQEERRESPQVPALGLNQNLNQNLSQSPNLRPKKPVRPEEPPKRVVPHPVLTESDLKRIVQMAHRGS